MGIAVFNFDELRAKSKAVLIDFLYGELELSKTLLQSAQLAADAGHHEHAAEAKAKVQIAAATIRRYVKGVPEGDIKAGIQERLSELDGMIAEFSNCPPPGGIDSCSGWPVTPFPSARQATFAR